MSCSPRKSIARTPPTPPGVLSYIRSTQDQDALIWIDSKGKTVNESSVRIFLQAKCNPETSALPRRDDHHRLVARSVRIVEGERTVTKAGQFGSSRGACYRCYEMLQGYLRHREGDLFLNDQVRTSIQAIHDYPLTTEAADKLNRQLRSGIPPDNLANLVTTLHRDDRLVVANHHDAPSKQPRIICSLGLKE